MKCRIRFDVLGKDVLNVLKVMFVFCIALIPLVYYFDLFLLSNNHEKVNIIHYIVVLGLCGWAFLVFILYTDRSRYIKFKSDKK